MVDLPVWLNYTRDDMIKMGRTTMNHVDVNDETVVLDVGCGNGIFLEPFYEITKRIHGVDIIENNITNCKRRFHDIKDNFVADDAMNYLRNSSRKFDVIVMKGVVGCFRPSAQKELIRACKNVLRKDGVLIVSSVQLKDDSYLFQTYSYESCIQELDTCFDRVRGYNEWNFFQIEKYSKDMQILFCD
jgi:2-polyprenyl-3-methyl-5-hydroxy-6-metoxy-1,4-benzoquinol methylase